MGSLAKHTVTANRNGSDGKNFNDFMQQLFDKHLNSMGHKKRISLIFNSLLKSFNLLTNFILQCITWTLKKNADTEYLDNNLIEMLYNLYEKCIFPNNHDNLLSSVVINHQTIKINEAPKTLEEILHLISLYISDLQTVLKKSKARFILLQEQQSLENLKTSTIQHFHWFLMTHILWGICTVSEFILNGINENHMKETDLALLETTISELCNSAINHTELLIIGDLVTISDDILHIGLILAFMPPRNSSRTTTTINQHDTQDIILALPAKESNYYMSLLQSKGFFERTVRTICTQQPHFLQKVLVIAALCNTVDRNYVFINIEGSLSLEATVGKLKMENFPHLNINNVDEL